MRCFFESSSTNFSTRIMTFVYSLNSRCFRASFIIYLSLIIVIMTMFDRSRNRLMRYRSQTSKLLSNLINSFLSFDIFVVYHIMTIKSRSELYEKWMNRWLIVESSSKKNSYLLLRLSFFFFLSERIRKEEVSRETDIENREFS